MTDKYYLIKLDDEETCNFLNMNKQHCSYNAKRFPCEPYIFPCDGDLDFKPDFCPLKHVEREQFLKKFTRWYEAT